MFRKLLMWLNILIRFCLIKSFAENKCNIIIQNNELFYKYNINMKLQINEYNSKKNKHFFMYKLWPK